MHIVTDSAADLTPQDVDDHQIRIAPLLIQFPDGEVSADRISPDDFYERLESMQPETPTTAQPSPQTFSDLYQSIPDKSHSVLSIHISSGLSGTANAARIGAEQTPGKEVHVIDSLTLSGGQRFQILAAARAIQAGWSLEQILQRLAQVRQATEVIYTLDTLKYLARGGRIGRVQALAGSVLNIKPLIHVDKEDGKYSTVGRSRTMSRALGDITSHLADMYPATTPVWVSVMHGSFQERADQLAGMLKEALNVSQLEVLRISPVLGVHTGPGIVGATVVPIDLMEI